MDGRLVWSSKIARAAPPRRADRDRRGRKGPGPRHRAMRLSGKGSDTSPTGHRRGGRPWRRSLPAGGTDRPEDLGSAATYTNLSSSAGTWARRHLGGRLRARPGRLPAHWASVRNRLRRPAEGPERAPTGPQGLAGAQTVREVREGLGGQFLTLCYLEVRTTPDGGRKLVH